MQISDDVLCVFSQQLTEQHGSYIIEVPVRELDDGELEQGGVYRVALLAPPTTPSENQRSNPDQEGGGTESGPAPPVTEGDRRTVDIEAIGEQGDGIARVDRGYVVIVPETELNERVTVEIIQVTETVAFGDVVERSDDDA